MRPQCHHFRAFPAVQFLGKIDGNIIVGHRNQRFDAIFVQFTENIMIKLYALGQGLFLSSGGEKAGPFDAHTEGLEAHLAEQCDVLFIMVIEIDTFAEREIIRRVVCGIMCLVVLEHFRGDVQHTVVHTLLAGQITNIIHVRQPAAALVGTAFILASGGCTAPQKSFGEFNRITHD